MPIAGAAVHKQLKEAPPPPPRVTESRITGAEMPCGAARRILLKRCFVDGKATDFGTRGVPRVVPIRLGGEFTFRDLNFGIQPVPIGK